MSTITSDSSDAESLRRMNGYSRMLVDDGNYRQQGETMALCPLPWVDLTYDPISLFYAFLFASYGLNLTFRDP